MRAAVIASTDPTVAPSVDFDMRAHISGNTLVTPTGETWTLQGNAAVEGGKFAVSQWDAKGPYGYLAETAGENKLLQSDAFTTTWAASNSAPVVNYAIAPDGTKTAWRLIDDSGAGGNVNVGVTQGITLSNAAWSVSV